MSCRACTVATIEWRTRWGSLSKHQRGETRRGLGIPQPALHDAERAALDLAVAAGAQPNEVTDEMFERVKRYWTEGQIVEIVALVSFFGFMNRYNDTMATPLEDEPIEVAEKHIAQHGWTLGKHGR
jgi:alkylhydroperoxidase family enzyme